MTDCPRAKRIAYRSSKLISQWRGSFVALSFFTGWMLLSTLAGGITQ